VTVEGAAPVVETDVPSISDVKTLRDLPLNIRSTVSGTGDSGFYRYVFMTPTGGQGGGSRFSLGGGRGSQNSTIRAVQSRDLAGPRNGLIGARFDF
jgi:hypothetical protein